jgi:hypothetical protein
MTIIVLVFELTDYHSHNNLRKYNNLLFIETNDL